MESGWKKKPYKLGAGSFGTVWKIEKCITGGQKEERAVKCCHNYTMIDQWRREIETMNKISKDNVEGIVYTYDLETDIRKLFDDPDILVMEYCTKGDLREKLRLSCCGLAESVVRNIMWHISRGLEHLHLRKDICHRDLKPENILVTTRSGKEVYLIGDIGLCKAIGDNASGMKSSVGTQAYMAPEINKSAEYSRAVDIWSLGVILHECITGLRPFYHGEPWHEITKDDPTITIFASCNPSVASERFEHSPSIEFPNRLCRTSQYSFEKLLRMMLHMDPHKRGADSPAVKGTSGKRRRDKWWLLLNKQIIDIKLVFVHVSPTSTVLSYPTVEGATIRTLQDSICNSLCKHYSGKDNSMKVGDILILHPAKGKLDLDEPLEDHIKEETKFDKPRFNAYVTCPEYWDGYQHSISYPEALKHVLNMSSNSYAQIAPVIFLRFLMQAELYCETRMDELDNLKSSTDKLEEDVTSLYMNLVTSFTQDNEAAEAVRKLRILVDHVSKCLRHDIAYVSGLLLTTDKDYNRFLINKFKDTTEKKINELQSMPETAHSTVILLDIQGGSKVDLGATFRSMKGLPGFTDSLKLSLEEHQNGCHKSWDQFRDKINSHAKLQITENEHGVIDEVKLLISQFDSLFNKARENLITKSKMLVEFRFKISQSCNVRSSLEYDIAMAEAMSKERAEDIINLVRNLNMEGFLSSKISDEALDLRLEPQWSFEQSNTPLCSNDTSQPAHQVSVEAMQSTFPNSITAAQHLFEDEDDDDLYESKI